MFYYHFHATKPSQFVASGVATCFCNWAIAAYTAASFSSKEQVFLGLTQRP
ncbi:MAG: hypothetical protein F6K22_27620 [Okeania sp. SIO2F4]|uniref:hypothetical protein n=1 Tax=Okeania sp. SIO2F4 TaxID=2607790 RepID=UPI00142D10A3|nr:hypothetical protein [Okeania sp. SIO2F4]NES06250.1 hypothetical protein [Okeania sp. SIO2F4]